MLTGEMSFEGANILNISICANELKGGDSGHGGFCVFKFQSDDEFYVNGQPFNEIELTFTGDSERINLRDAFQYMADYLNQELK